MTLNEGFVAKGKRRRADTGEHENTADWRPRLLTKRQRSASHYPDVLQKLSAPGALLADSDDYQRQRMMTCAAMEPMLLDHHDAQHRDGVPLYGGAMLATPATSPPHGVSDSDECRNGGDDDNDDDDDELDPASEYYEISKLLNQLHHERMIRRKQQ
ncbi:hypothetical protein GGI23_006487 [Coemansia sp. RSA 2559]|nr:hypothetical protein GGI23_006487 [Coemansia sp. RSA 2559]KAJ2867886.1 hypothetical protein GGI22_000952 [Coemansia erecta]